MKKCPVCGKEVPETDSGDWICDCGWEMDDDQEQHPDETGFNPVSLNEAKKLYQEGKSIFANVVYPSDDFVAKIRKRFRELGIMVE